FVTSMNRHRPSPTSFPYTTLFRSPGGQRDQQPGCDRIQLAHVPERVAAQVGAQRRGRPALSKGAVHPPWRNRSMSLMLSAPATIDRKSTRLNSSHVKISYAVFCLK